MARPLGTVWEASPGVWRVRLVIGYEDGTPRYKQFTHRGTAKTAQAFRAKVVAALHPASGSKNKTPNSWTVKEALDRWSEVHGKMWSANQRRNLPSIIRKLEPLHPYKVRNLTFTTIEAFRNSLLEEYKPSYVKRILGTLSTCLTWCIRQGRLDANPAVGVVVPSSAKRAEAPTTEAVAAFLEAIRDDHPRYHAAFRLLAVSGARRGEVVGLKWSDVVGETITFRRTIGSDGARTIRESLKSSEIKSLKVDKETASRLRESKVDEVWVFGDDDQPWRPDRLTLAYRRLQARYGCELGGVHGLRHYAASKLLAEGAPLAEVSHRLGHKKMSTTLDVYGHLIEPDRRIADKAASGL